MKRTSEIPARPNELLVHGVTPTEEALPEVKFVKINPIEKYGDSFDLASERALQLINDRLGAIQQQEDF